MHIIFKNGLASARKNFIPGLILQGFALTMVLLYYFHQPTHQFLLKIPEIKQRMGALFPIITASFFGGFIPFLFMAVQKTIRREQYVSHLLFLTGYWALNGWIIDLLYQGQALWFGDQPDVLTIVKKTAVDQFLFCPLWSVPFAAVTMHWKNCDFSFKTACARFSRKTFTIELLSILIAIWAVWIPAVAIIYSLPMALQFPLFNIVLCFWSLLLTALSNGDK